MKGRNDQRVGCRRGINFLNKSSINSMNKKIVWEKGNISIIRRKVRVGKMRQHIGGAHGRARDVDKLKIKILEEHYPTSLSLG